MWGSLCYWDAATPLSTTTPSRSILSRLSPVASHHLLHVCSPSPLREWLFYFPWIPLSDTLRPPAVRKLNDVSHTRVLFSYNYDNIPSYHSSEREFPAPSISPSSPIWFFLSWWSRSMSTCHSFQRGVVEEAGIVLQARRFDDNDNFIEFVHIRGFSACSLRPETVAHFHFLTQTNVTVDFPLIHTVRPQFGHRHARTGTIFVFLALIFNKTLNWTRQDVKFGYWKVARPSFWLFSALQALSVSVWLWRSSTAKLKIKLHFVITRKKTAGIQTISKKANFLYLSSEIIFTAITTFFSLPLSTCSL